MSPVGEVDYRDKVLSFYSQAQKIEDSISLEIGISDVKVKTDGDYAFVIVREHFVDVDKQRDFSMRVSFTLKKTRNNWLFFNAQYTGIRP